MKHGDKGKKAAKAVQASGKKSGSKEALTKTGIKEAGSAAKSSKEAGAKKAGAKAPEKVPAKTAAKAESKASSGNGKAGKVIEGPVSFNNPIVANAFKRAVKKYPNAFRRLTD